MRGRPAGGSFPRVPVLAVFVAVITVIGCIIPPSASAQVINACYQKINGQLRVVGLPSECRPSEVPLSWNIQGPPGPKGDKGDKGDQGPPGAGLTNVTRLTWSSRNNSDSPKHAFAKCPDGYQVIDCGGQVFIGEKSVKSGPIALKKSLPSKSLHGCAVEAEEMSPTDLRWFVTATAVCATAPQSPTLQANVR